MERPFGDNPPEIWIPGLWLLCPRATTGWSSGTCSDSAVLSFGTGRSAGVGVSAGVGWSTTVEPGGTGSSDRGGFIGDLPLFMSIENAGMSSCPCLPELKVQYELFIGARRELNNLGPLARLNGHSAIAESYSSRLMLAKVGDKALMDDGT